MAKLFLVSAAMLAAADLCGEADANMSSGACHGECGIALLQSSAREVRSLSRPGLSRAHNQHFKWEWGKSGGFVKWKDHSITLAFDASLYKVTPNQDLAMNPMTGPVVLRVVFGVLIVLAISNIMVVLMLVLLVPTTAVVQAASSIMFQGKRGKKASKVMGVHGAGQASILTDADTKAPALLPPRQKSSWPWAVTFICVLDLLLNLVLVLLFAGGKLLTQNILPFLLLETLASSIVFLCFASWDDQRHLITAWQVLQAIRFFLLRRTIYAHFGTYVASLLLLLAVSSAGAVAELSVEYDVRLPPFEPKKMDVDRPTHGWLGPYAQSVQSKSLRRLITGVFFIADMLKYVLFVYFFTDGPENDTAQVSDGTFYQLAAASMLLQCALTFLPAVTQIHAAVIQMKTWCEHEPLLRAYRTGPYEVSALANDQSPDSDLQKQLQDHQCRSITVVLPAYMPNEEDIVLDCLEVYRQEAAKYPGILRVLLVWNSPQEHTWIEQKLQELQAEWPAFEAHRNHMSTSKCDNLNMAVDLLRTEFALFNDVDTMVSAESMCRASLRLFEEGHDTVQARLVHCWEDFAGITDNGFFALGAITTCHDAVRHSVNEVIYGPMQMPFCNGRGSFWRTDAIKKVGFDHRTVGEDHDAMFRAWAYYGMKGALDDNILCQEREPPDFQNLVNQRTRWYSGQIQKLRCMTWFLRSTHISAFFKMVVVYLDWVDKPFQGWAFNLFMWVLGYMLKSRACAFNPLMVTTVMGTTVVLPLFVVVLLVAPMAIQKAASLLETRYRPRWLAWILVSFISPWAYSAMRETVCRCRMLHDFLWSGDVEFICTTRDKTPSRSPSVMSPASHMSPSTSFHHGFGGSASQLVLSDSGERFTASQ